MATWDEMLRDAFAETGDDIATMVCTLSPEERAVVFNDGYGGVEGKFFTAWGDKYVYFPVCYDGSEWVGWAPRNPCDIATFHWGGG